MNPYIQHLNRIEFVITNACTGACKHCSEGGNRPGPHIDGAAGAKAVREVAAHYNIASLMTFGGEPLLFPQDVCAIHAAGRQAGIPKRQIITNGFFARDEKKIAEIANMLAQAGVNDVLLSVDAFHQETIPLAPVKFFAKAVQKAGVPLRINPAWLVALDAENPYNKRTREILDEFADLGVFASEGNVIFPAGNALLYLGEYFAGGDVPVNPYADDPYDIDTFCIGPDGRALGGNIYKESALDILLRYTP